MSQSDRAIKKLATQLARLDREVKSWRGAQADYTSIEAGTMDINDSDGNLVSRVGFQDDGSGAVRFFDGPVPPVPSGVTASADGPIIQATWDGTFADGAEATYDLAYLEVAATQVDDDSNVSFATITAKEGASASVVADVTGDWVVAVRSVSQAGKKSEFATAGTVEVKVTDLSGAIEDVQQSANGKNQVHYSTEPPTEADAGIVGDTWWVGMDGRPEEVLATNLVLNPSADPTGSPWGNTGGGGESVAMSYRTRGGLNTARATLTSTSGYTYLMPGQSVSAPDKLTPVTPGETISASMLVACSVAGNRNLRFGFRNSSGAFQSWSSDGPSTALQADGDLVELKIENVTVPSGAAYAYVHTRGPLEGQGNWIEGTHAQVVKSPTVGDYFSGDTEDGATNNELHYRWTGEPHASTSEQYLPEIGSGVWNIIEQYQYTPDGWTQVELSHEVIATVDLGKATVGELDGIRIMGQTIRGEQLSGDAIDGKVITGGTYRTSGGSGSWSDAGLFIAQPDGTSMVRFPTDGSPLSLTASDTQIERASIGKLDVESGSIRSGGTLNLASGVTPPPSPPEAVSAWDMTVNLPRPPEQRMDWNGFAAWGDKWVRGVNVLGTGEGDRLEVYNADGTLNKTIPILIDPRHDLTVIGDVCYVFGKDHAVTANDVYCFAYNLTTGARVARWRFSTNAPNQQIGVTSVGSDLLTAQVSADGDALIVRRRDASTGLVIESSPSGDAVWDLNYTRDVKGIHWDGTDLYVTHRDSTRVYTYSSSGYTRKAGSSHGTQWAGWANPNRNAGGMVFVGSEPVVVSGGVYVGSAITSDSTIEACFTWHSGGYETTPSPVLSTLVEPRETLTVSLPSRAGLSKRVYVRKGSTGTWARYAVPENQTAIALSSIQTGLYPLPTTNTFPNADPAVLQSTNGNVVVRGDGSGKWGPLTFNADGSMTSTQIPAWVPVTTFASGFSPQTFGYAPAYRVWPDGKVEWRGIVAGSMAAGPSGDYAILTIPAEARPTQPVDMISATGTGGGAHGMVRIEFTNVNNPDKLMVLVRQANITWVSLDGHYYYKD